MLYMLLGFTIYMQTCRSVGGCRATLRIDLNPILATALRPCRISSLHVLWATLNYT